MPPAKGSAPTKSAWGGGSGGRGKSKSAYVDKEKPAQIRDSNITAAKGRLFELVETNLPLTALPLRATP